ncbi:MAG: TetR/AcrR family transcriptional regulator [Gemmatimonadota bacterium]|nr:TetR/AcrR family transcriptional regulator [Gemmatimonadota bacterium]
MHAAPQPANSRELILDTAERLFATQGFARTPIKQIGREAGVNSALLYYYFADKVQLYREVLQRFMDRLVSRTTSAATAAGPPDARLRAFLEAQAETLAGNPHFPRLLARELVESDAAHAVEQIQRLAATGFRRLCEIIEDGQRAKLFRADLDPRFAAISCVSQIAHFFVALPAIRVLLDAPANGPSPEVVRSFARHAADFALSALMLPPRHVPRKRR